MIRLSYASSEDAHLSRINAGWVANPDGSYTHRRLVATIDGSTVTITTSPAALFAEVAAAIEDSAARREEREFDARQRA